MLNCSASLAMSTSVLKALPGKLISKDTNLVFSIFADLRRFDLGYDKTIGSFYNFLTVCIKGY